MKVRIGRAVMALLTFGLGWGAAPASATVTFNYVTDTTSVSVAPSATKDVLIYLQETVTSPSSSILVSEKGLFNAGLRVTRGSVPSSPALITALTGNSTDFPTQGSPTVSASSATLTEGVNVSATTGAPSTDLGGGVRRTYLGKVTVQGGTVANQQTTFTLGSFQTNQTITFTTGYDLDVNRTATPAYTGTTTTPLPANATFTVTTTPEPASFAFVGLGAVGILVRRRRKCR